MSTSREIKGRPANEGRSSLTVAICCLRPNSNLFSKSFQNRPFTLVWLSVTICNADLHRYKMKVCSACGVPIPATDNVCEPCFNKPFLCAFCGQPKMPGSDYCSDECAFTHRPETVRTIHCRWCGIEFRTQGTALYCSGRCRVANHRAGKSHDPLVVGPVGLSLRFAVLERDNFRCVYCGRTAAEARLEIDHVHPRNKGGADLVSNLVAACFECNRGKRDVILSRRP